MRNSRTSRKSEDLSQRMRQEWDRRVSHDYRYWMSDGVETDASMWRAGERDFAILIQGLEKEELRGQTALEIGCGVGRLLRPAASYLNRVIGLDVSSQAIERAGDLLKDQTNVELLLGNGVDLSAVDSGSIDFAFTFAALSSMPVSVTAEYLKELSRVVRTGGIMRLQIYIGEEQETSVEDTLAIRVYSENRLRMVFQELGFYLERVDQLCLPFEISSPEDGFWAKIVTLKRTSDTANINADIEGMLMSRGEDIHSDTWQGSKTEYLMALARAHQHLIEGSVKEAISALKYAVSYYSEHEADAVALLSELEAMPEKVAVQPEAGPLVSIRGSSPKRTAFWNEEIYAKNLAVLSECFPVEAAMLNRIEISDAIVVEKSASGEAVLVYNNMPLNNLHKPVQAGQSWAKRTLNSSLVESSGEIIVAGFSDGHHIETLLSLSDKPIHVVEVCGEILKTALSLRDCRRLIQGIRSLSLSGPGFQEKLGGIDALNAVFLVHPQSQVVVGERINEIKQLYSGARGLGNLRPNIAVVGPMWGGSQPMVNYTTNGLQMLKQRVIPYDFAEFYTPYTQLGGFLKKKSHRGVVENQYLEMLSSVVLEGIKERPVDIVICLAQAPLTPRVLTELRSRGIITVMWFVEDCRRFTTWQEIAKYYDYFFVIQKGEFPRMMEQSGAGRSFYLPVACDASIHRPLVLSPEEKERWGSSLSFVGAGYNNRRHLFSLFAKRDLKIWGTEWPACLPFTNMVQDSGKRIAVEDYVKVFNASKINMNIHSSSERDGIDPFGDFVNPRTFELACCGAFQLVDNRSLLGEKFEIGKEVATFSDEKEMFDKIEFYSENPSERARITQAARARALREHTYSHRLKTMLNYIYADRYEELSQRAERTPWKKTLSAAEEFPELKTRFQSVFERGEEPKLENLIGDIHTGKGNLTETEQKLLFLHHIQNQVSHVSKLRKEGS